MVCSLEKVFLQMSIFHSFRGGRPLLMLKGPGLNRAHALWSSSTITHALQMACGAKP